ncbi:MAG: hypothetical protein AAB529_02565 [Patescibacteria group bacterium]
MQQVDKRTFIIAVMIVVIALPIIILTFRKSFFPIIASIGQKLNSASLINSGTGIPVQLLPEKIRESIGK